MALQRRIDRFDCVELEYRFFAGTVLHRDVVLSEMGHGELIQLMIRARCAE
ncbi:hypothetical protein D3C85_1933480 [compost metagenome]